jgi:hypothetical protein
MRKTSVDCYRIIKENGLLSQRRFQVYNYLFEHGPATQRTAIKSLTGDQRGGSITSRFSELERLGVIETCGTVVDPDTEMRVLLWDVTNKLPIKMHDTTKKCPTCEGKGYINVS